jgi:hypothetical protein
MVSSELATPEPLPLQAAAWSGRICGASGGNDEVSVHQDKVAWDTLII